MDFATVISKLVVFTSGTNQEFQFEMDGTLRPNISNMCLDVQSSGEILIWAGMNSKYWE